MRKIGIVQTNERAKSLGDFLFLKGVANTIEAGRDGAWEVWVHDDDQLEEAQRWVAEFDENVDAISLEALRKKASQERRRKDRKERAGQKAVVEGHQIWSGAGATALGYFTVVLMVISCGFFLLSQMQRQGGYPDVLFITSVDEQGGYIQWQKGLPEIRNGQVWRLITPIFMHFGWIHLIFNMMWLADLGSMVERSKGTWFLALLVLVTAVLSNLGQYLVSSPYFGGMSGVVYALLGYVWMLGRYDPSKGMALHQSTVTMMLVWFVLCFTGVLGSIANTAHAVGLALGVVWGFLESGGAQRVLRRI